MFSRDNPKPQKYPYRTQTDEFNIRRVYKEVVGRPIIRNITTYIADSPNTLNKILITGDKVLELLISETPNKKKEKKKSQFIHTAIQLGITGMIPNKPVFVNFIEVNAIHRTGETAIQSYSADNIREKFIEMTHKIKQLSELVESSKITDEESLSRKPLFPKPKKEKKKHFITKKFNTSVLSSIAEIGVPSTKIILFVTVSRTGDADAIYESIRFANFKRNLQPKK